MAYYAPRVTSLALMWTQVAPVSSIAVGDYAQTEVDGVIVAVFNVGGEFYAIEDQCTHDGGGLAGGVIEDCQVICPRHGARFSLKTGEALTPPAYESVQTYEVRINNGIVEVREAQ